MIAILSGPWPWYVAGPLIGLVVPALLLLGNKSFGISAALRHVCAACVPAGLPFFTYDWRRETWNLYFVVGIGLGAVIAATLLRNPEPVALAVPTRVALEGLGLHDFSGLMPAELFSVAQLATGRGLVLCVAGGFLVGFGTRWAGGCTSGHTIMGLSTLQWPSLVATACFFIGGLAGTWVVLPWLLRTL